MLGTQTYKLMATANDQNREYDKRDNERGGPELPELQTVGYVRQQRLNARNRRT